MNSTDLTNNYLSELGQRIGIKVLKLNELSQCTLTTPKGLDITIEAVPDETQCLLHADIASVMPAGVGRENQLMKLCELNHLGSGTGGAVLSVNPDRSHVSLAWPIDLRHCDYQDFENQLSQFIRTAEELSLAFSQSTTTQGEDVEVAGQQENPLSHMTMLRV